MKKIELTAKTSEDAISEGLAQLGVSISDVKVEILEEGSKGLFGLFGSRPARVRLTVREDDETSEVHQLFAEAMADQPAKPAAKPVQAASVQEKPVQEKPVQEKSAQVKPAAQPKPARAAEAPAAAPAEEQKKPEKKPVEKAPKAPAKAAADKPAKPKEPAQAKPQPAQEKPVVPAEKLDPATIAGKAQTFLTALTGLMGVETQVHMTTDEEGFLHADLQGDTSGILIGRRGETLDAMQYLTSLHINKGQSEYTRITLDTENYRARREDTLIRLANRYANRAVKTGRRVSVEPMNPYERRIMHSALQENDLVDTHSEGEEPNRHIVITPRKQPAQNKAE